MKEEQNNDRIRSPYEILKQLEIHPDSSMKEIKDASLKMFALNLGMDGIEALDRLRNIQTRLLTDFFLYQSSGRIYSENSLENASQNMIDLIAEQDQGSQDNNHDVDIAESQESTENE